MSIKSLRGAVAASLALLWALPLQASAAPSDMPEFEGNSLKPGAITKYFDLRHDFDFAFDAVEELTGTRPAKGTDAQQFAGLVLAELGKLPAYGQKSTANLRPYPEWFIRGYDAFKPRTVLRSRYLDGVLYGGEQYPEPDIIDLYAYWTLYDAEWFAVSRNPAFKSWLSAVALTYPPEWAGLGQESEADLLGRLVEPITHEGEDWKEIRAWISNFKAEIEPGQDRAFIKPKVRDGLVQELLAEAGLKSDDRFYERAAYSGPTPTQLGLTDRQFYLLAALTLEFFQEIYDEEPGSRQPLHFRDYFVAQFESNL